MIRLPAVMATVFLALSVFLAAAAAQENQLNEQDREFMKKAASGGMMEVQLGRMAQEKAADETVKKFGRRMIEDHSEANEDLKKIAGLTNVDLPRELDAKHRRKVDELAAQEGEAFDRGYIGFMVEDHAKDIEMYRREIREGHHPQVRQYAADVFPKLHQHRQWARFIQN